MEKGIVKEKSLERGEEGNINESLWQRRETKRAQGKKESLPPKVQLEARWQTAF